MPKPNQITLLYRESNDGTICDFFQTSTDLALHYPDYSYTFFNVGRQSFSSSDAILFFRQKKCKPIKKEPTYFELPVEYSRKVPAECIEFRGGHRQIIFDCNAGFRASDALSFFKLMGKFLMANPEYFYLAEQLSDLLDKLIENKHLDARSAINIQVEHSQHCNSSRKSPAMQ